MVTEVSMTDKTELRERLEFRKAALTSAREAYKGIMSGTVQSYKIGDREITKLNIGVLAEEITRLEKEYDELSGKLSGKRTRRTFGVSPRDW